MMRGLHGMQDWGQNGDTMGDFMLGERRRFGAIFTRMG